MEKIEKFEDLKGHILSEIIVVRNQTAAADQIIFRLESGETHRLYHRQDCCEDVSIEEIVGNLEDLLETTILSAEVEQSISNLGDNEEERMSTTWTFYRLSTKDGYVTIRWYGESNGFYSEEVDFE